MIYSIFREIFDRELLDICETIRLLLCDIGGFDLSLYYKKLVSYKPGYTGSNTLLQLVPP